MADHRTFAEVVGMGLSESGPPFEVHLAFTPEQATALLRSRPVDLVLLGYPLGSNTSSELLTAIHSVGSNAAVIILSGLDDVDAVVQALSLGARAWVPKEVNIDQLLVVIHEVLQGQMWLPGSLLGPVLERLLMLSPRGRQRSFVDDLTPRQLEVLESLAQGKSRTQIASEMRVSSHTLRTHVQAILKKAGAHSTLAALAQARAAGNLNGNPAMQALARDRVR